MHRLGHKAKALWQGVSGFVWPERSILSGERTEAVRGIPAEEFAQLRFLNGAGCRRCALPLDIDLGEENLCGRCASKPPRWTAARAAIAYDDISKRAILDLKHAGRRDGLDILGNWLTLAGHDILPDTDFLIPVPLHYRRLVKRGFNQSALLAQQIRKKTGTPILYGVLTRNRATPSQGGLTARQRRRNVAGAFSLRAGPARKLEGKTVTLVDDVYTTGSTLAACTRILKQSGANRVNVLVLARVVRDEDITI